MLPDPLVVLACIAFVLAAGAVGAAAVLAKRVGLVVPFAFIAAYVLTVGAITFVNVGVFNMGEGPWLALYWPLWTAFLAPAAISALLACWLSRPLARGDATALLGLYLFLILITVEISWVFDSYSGFWSLIGELALLTAIFFAVARVKRRARTSNLPALSDSGIWISGLDHKL